MVVGCVKRYSDVTLGIHSVMQPQNILDTQIKMYPACIGLALGLLWAGFLEAMQGRKHSCTDDPISDVQIHGPMHLNAWLETRRMQILLHGNMLDTSWIHGQCTRWSNQWVCMTIKKYNFASSTTGMKTRSQEKRYFI